MDGLPLLPPTIFLLSSSSGYLARGAADMVIVHLRRSQCRIQTLGRHVLLSTRESRCLKCAIMEAQFPGVKQVGKA